jgi:uncharacterized membrane protein
VRENATHSFFPENDFSLVIENAAAGIGPINLRKVDNKWFDISTTVYATLYVDNAVNVTISPSYQEGTVGENLTYTVTVQNTGRYDDNYSLDISAGGWSYKISPPTVSIPAGGSENATLSVTLGAGAQDITVTATGAYASDNSMTSAVGVPFSISIFPDENSALLGENVGFTIIVRNLGENVDNYSLVARDDAGWGLALDDNLLENVAPGENRTTGLTVTIPDNENLIGVEDNITVIATSQANPWASDNATCIARAGFYGVRVSILPDYQENAPGGRLNYAIRISNTGTVNDSYELTFRDNINGDAYWEENISLDNSLLAVPAGENRTTTLRVTIPDNAPPGTEDNITVTATSRADNRVSDNYSCIAHVARLSISISPDYQSGLPGEKLIYDVYIKNNENADGDYCSVVTDNLGWRLEFGFKRIILSPFGEAWTLLKVTIPEDAIGCVEDNVTVTMVSYDNTIRYSASCVAHSTIVRGVKVSITPKENRGPPGATLRYIVEVKNTGNVEDTYDLEAKDDAGWGLEILPTSLTIPPRGFENAVLNVTIPENAEPEITDNIIVTATSQENENVTAENSCTAYSLAVFKLDLLRGWNLISFPLASENDTPANMFAGLDYTMYYWEAPYGPYKRPFDNQPVTLGVGYWVKLSENTTVTTAGVPIENYSIDLVAGWNLVGFPLTSADTTPDNMFAGMSYTMYYWEAPYGPYKRPFPDQPVKLGLGYWVKLSENMTITVPL